MEPPVPAHEQPPPPPPPSPASSSSHDRTKHQRRNSLTTTTTLLLLLSSLHFLLLLVTPTAAAAPPGRRRGLGTTNGITRTLELSYKRLLQEYKDVMASGMALSNHNSSLSNNTEHIRLSPCRGNLHEWHFSIAGPPGSVYEGGIYHGRIILPADYPQSAPRLQMLNPSGRFEVGADICLSVTAFHQETWQPVWTVRTLVSALRSHMATKAVEVGGIEAPARRRLFLAQRSRGFKCRGCGVDHANFPGCIFKDMPEVEGLPKRMKVVEGEGEGEGEEGGRVVKRRTTRGGGGGSSRLATTTRGTGSSSSLFISMYRHKFSLVLVLAFVMAFLFLNVP